MTRLDELKLERMKILKEIGEIFKAENQSKLETAKQYIGRCFSYKDDEIIKILGCRVCESVIFDVLSFSNSRVDGYILWYDECEFYSIIECEDWEEITVCEFVKYVTSGVQKLLEE